MDGIIPNDANSYDTQLGRVQIPFFDSLSVAPPPQAVELWCAVEWGRTQPNGNEGERFYMRPTSVELILPTPPAVVPEATQQQQQRKQEEEEEKDPPPPILAPTNTWHNRRQLKQPEGRKPPPSRPMDAYGDHPRPRRDRRPKRRWVPPSLPNGHVPRPSRKQQQRNDVYNHGPPSWQRQSMASCHSRDTTPLIGRESDKATGIRRETNELSSPAESLGAKEQNSHDNHEGWQPSKISVDGEDKKVRGDNGGGVVIVEAATKHDQNHSTNKKSSSSSSSSSSIPSFTNRMNEEGPTAKTAERLRAQILQQMGDGGKIGDPVNSNSCTSVSWKSSSYRPHQQQQQHHSINKRGGGGWHGSLLPPASNSSSQVRQQRPVPRSSTVLLPIIKFILPFFSLL
jgi:hypothetical protein